MSPRTYLLTRFQADAVALRERAESLRIGPARPGPDATMSSHMADACEVVVAMVSAIAAQDDAAEEIDALVALVPLLEQRATAAGKMPAVRAVYAGAATRIREVRDVESRADHAGGAVLDDAIDSDDIDSDEADIA